MNNEFWFLFKKNECVDFERDKNYLLNIPPNIGLFYIFIWFSNENLFLANEKIYLATFVKKKSGFIDSGFGVDAMSSQLVLFNKYMLKKLKIYGTKSRSYSTCLPKSRLKLKLFEKARKQPRLSFTYPTIDAKSEPLSTMTDCKVQPENATSRGPRAALTEKDNQTQQNHLHKRRPFLQDWGRTCAPDV